MNPDSQECRAFAERLRRLMIAKGHTSERSRSGVEVAALSRGAAISYEMARRYAEGMAMPRPDVLSRISNWLEVEPAAIAFGAVKVGESEIDAVLLEECIRAVADAQASAGAPLAADQAARLVARLYSEARSGRRPSSSTLAALLGVIFKTR